ncbi:serine/threonine-protein phosphatase 4 regulatory subunit 2-like [Mya arenaria]|uniref:serine/threonine-protein phosphatase 4 regulatory subunit 2-like n=1 Tax=Mya arenaria TaxID=6604 RepID=UPI0022E8E7F1|nr:serine/threonine-protein phosphatase 4 regulatory subunit 2-like [Mya arenaria]
MENQDKIQTVLEDFEKEPGKEIPTVLEEYLQTVAKTGKTVFQWPLLKTLFVQKLEQVMDEFNKDNPCERPTPYPNVENAKFDDMRKRILEAMHRFTSAPFTIQRLCELFSQPKKHYTQCDKFLRGIEKNVMVVSTVDPQGKKIVSESRGMVNGLDMNGSSPQNNELDINDGHPFGSIPQVEWTSVGPTTVWPSSMDANDSNSSTSNEGLEKLNENEATVRNDSDCASNDSIRTDSKVGSSDEGNKSVDDDRKSLGKNAEENVNNSNSANTEDQNLVVSDCVKLPPSSSLFSRISGRVISGETNEAKEVTSETDAITNSDIHEAVDMQAEAHSETKCSNEVTEENISSSGSSEESKEETEPSVKQLEDKRTEEFEDQEEERPETASKKETSSSFDDNTDEPPEKRMRLSTEDSSVSSSGSPGEQPSGEASDQQIGEAESTTQAEQSESTHTTQEDSGNSNEAEPSAVPDETPSDIGQPNSSSIQPDQSNDTLQSCDQTESEPNKVAVEKSDSKVEDSDNSGKCESTSDDTQVAEEHKENQAEVKEENNEASSEASTSKTDDISADTSQDEVEMETDSASEEKNAENVPVVDESEPMDQE